MTARFKSLTRAYQRGHVDFSTSTKYGKVYITGARRRAKAHRNPERSYHKRLNNGDVERFIPYGQ